MGALLTPALGTLVWSSIAFLVVLFLLKRFAWGPILSALQEREQRITDALGSAERARQEMAQLNSDNERLLREARAEREVILKDAREAAEKLVSDARLRAKEEAERDLALAKDAIAIERKAAIAELKSEVAALSVSIAEQLVRRELGQDDAQQALVKKLMDESPLN
ncbi:MAG: synthase subunit [Bacteroidota bacterium]|jgi:F-type H+-transporting ATPase subunit b